MQFTTLALLALVAVAAATTNTDCPECKYAASNGVCINQECPTYNGPYSCIEDECVPNSAGVSAVPPVAAYIGPCIFGTLCPEQNYCYADNCYPIDFSNLALNE